MWLPGAGVGGEDLTAKNATKCRGGFQTRPVSWPSHYCAEKFSQLGQIFQRLIWLDRSRSELTAETLRALSEEFLIKKYSDLCELCGREKKSKFAGLSLPVDRMIFSVAQNHPVSAVVPIWAHPGADKAQTCRFSRSTTPLSPFFSCRRCSNSSFSSPAQTDPLADVIGQAGPQRFHSHLP